jgi:hypothetical protein
MTCQHNKNHRVEAKIACFKDRPNGFMAELRIFCGDCGKPCRDPAPIRETGTQGARVSIDGLEASIAISPEGALPSPMQRMSYNINKFDG